HRLVCDLAHLARVEPHGLLHHEGEAVVEEIVRGGCHAAVSSQSHHEIRLGAGEHLAVVREGRQSAELARPLRYHRGVGIVQSHQLHVGQAGEDAQVGGIVERVPVAHLDGGDAHRYSMCTGAGASSAPALADEGGPMRTRSRRGRSATVLQNSTKSSQKSSAKARTWACCVTSWYTMARARRSAVKLSAPCAAKWAAHLDSRAAVSASKGLMWATSVAWCSCGRRARSMLTTAPPAPPPRLRTTLRSAVALPMLMRGMVARPTALRGTKMKPTPSPCTKRGQASPQQSTV